MAVEIHFGLLCRGRFSIREYHTVDMVVGINLTGCVSAIELTGNVVVEGEARQNIQDFRLSGRVVSQTMLTGEVQVETLCGSIYVEPGE